MIKSLSSDEYEIDLSHDTGFVDSVKYLLDFFMVQTHIKEPQNVLCFKLNEYDLDMKSEILAEIEELEEVYRIR